MDTYGHLFPGQEADTVARFPAMIERENLAAMGTEGNPSFLVAPLVEKNNKLSHSFAPICTTNISNRENAVIPEDVTNSPLSVNLHREASKEVTAPCRTRTYNPLIKSQLLCQLS